MEWIIIIVETVALLFLLKRQGKSSPHPLSPAQAEQQPNEKEISTTQEKLRYEALLDNIGEGLVVTDRSGKITTFNKAAESLLGWKEEETLGKNLHDVITIGYTRNQESKAIPGSQPALYFVRKDKTSFPVALTATSYIQGTDILGTITLFRDITAEQNIDKMKNEFISLASHQLRTPLSAIKWNIEMLINGDGGTLLPEQKEFADSVYTSTIRTIDLVNALLNISRIESGRIIVEPKPTDIKKLIEEVLEEVKIRFAEKNHTFKLIIHEEPLPPINLDPRLIRQAYVNLLTNAAKYTPEKGEITITLSKNNTDLVSEVRDNGYGIPEKEQEKVFDKFYRGENIIGKADGTGLGLYLIKTIIELSQGKIWYKSQEGKGTTFSFTLPLAGTQARKGVVSLDD